MTKLQPYYAEGDYVFARPTKSATGTSMGFLVCTATNPENAAAIARCLNQDEMPRPDPAAAIIGMALGEQGDPGDALALLRLWFEGDFAAIRAEWPDAPPEIFIGADPLYVAPEATEAAHG